MSTKKSLELNDLSKWSPWVARLLGAEPWTTPSRTIEKVEQEYDKDKYAKCLDYFNQTDGDPTPEDIKRFELSIDAASNICASYGDSLKVVSLEEARRDYYKLMSDTMRKEIEKCKTVVELGSGYGFNLWMLKQQFGHCNYAGGEYSKNAVKLSSGLHNEGSGIRVSEFNFYDGLTYSLLEQATPPFVIFTSHAVEQLHSWSTPFFNALAQHRDQILAVFHFEPVYEVQDETVLGLLRRGYIESNDYNRDLLSELQGRSDIHITDVESNVFGINPLNPTTVIKWRFAGA